MACKKTKSNCTNECVGCIHELSTECIYLEEALTCFDETLPKGTDLTEVFEAICEKFGSMAEEIADSIEISAINISVNPLNCDDESDFTGANLQIVLDNICFVVNNLTAYDITVTALSCIDESEVTGTDLQSVLNDICSKIDEINDIFNSGFTGTFEDNTGLTVTVVNGIITNVV